MAESERSDFVNWNLLKQGMEKIGLDVLVATSPENTAYLSRCYVPTYLWIRDRLNLVIVPRVDGHVTYLVAHIEIPLARSSTKIQDVRSYVEFVKSPIEALGEVLAERGLAKGRIGIETKFFTVDYHRELVRYLPHADIVSSDGILARTRAIKTPAEIERLQNAAVLTDAAVYEAWKQYRSGDTESDLAKRMGDELSKRGAERINHIYMGSGETTTILHYTPGAKKLQRGEIVHSDHGAVFEGFWSDMGRMGVVGKPSHHQRVTYKTLRDVYLGTISLMKPGVEVQKLFRFAKDEYLKRGIDYSWQTHIGHSMGQAAGHEEPMLRGENSTLLEPNMVFAVETCFRSENELYHLEDLVLITPHGSKILSNGWNTEELFLFE